MQVSGERSPFEPPPRASEREEEGGGIWRMEGAQTGGRKEANKKKGEKKEGENTQLVCSLATSMETHVEEGEEERDRWDDRDSRCPQRTRFEYMNFPHESTHVRQ